MVTSAADQTQRALETFTRLGYNPPGLLVLGAGYFETPALKAAGADSQGLLASAGWSREVAARNPAAKPVIELYEETFGDPMSEVAAGSFTAVLTLVKAMNDAGSIEPERVRTALLNLDIPGRDTIMPWNGVRFDATHQNIGATGRGRAGRRRRPAGGVPRRARPGGGQVAAGQRSPQPTRGSGR